MSMRHRQIVAVHLFFIKNNQILLARRFQTGYEDGKYSVPAGHVDPGETVISAAIREAKEEVGVQFSPEECTFCQVMHRRSDDERIDFFFTVTNWQGEPKICEPDKCDDIQWFPLEDLPTNIIPYVRQAVEKYLVEEPYTEFGW